MRIPRPTRIVAKAATILLVAGWFGATMQLEAGFAAGVPVGSANLTVFRHCVLSGTAGGSSSVVDSYVDENSATSNFGTTTTMLVRTRKSRNTRAYLSFDLSTCHPTIPSSATVTNATLRVWLTTLASSCETEDVFPVTSSWTVGTITWNNQPFGTSINNPSSGQTDAVNVGAATCTYSAAAQYVNWSVTTDVAQFVSGATTNYGWMIRDNSEDAAGSGITNTFGASDAGSVPHAPQLVVSYTT